MQVHRELAWLYQYADARVVSCVGGMDPRREQRELAAGAHIVVGTPGRLCDHLRRGRLDVSELKAVVLDEADEMLDLGFREDMEFILKTTPETRRTLLFSATLPRGIVALAKQYQQQAFRIEVAGDEGGHADIEYRAIRIAAGDVEHAVVNVLRFFESPSALVFCNTRDAVRHLQATLLERGFSVVALSGELTQNERTQALQALRDGRARVCVATDVAARGIDLPNLDLVIHADLPNDAGSHAASLRPHRPRRPQGRQRPAGAAGAHGGARNCCSIWPASMPSGAPRRSRTKSASSIRSACCRTRCSPRRRPTDDLVLAQALARRALARGYRRGAGAALSRAAAVARRHLDPGERSRPVSRRSRPGAGRPRRRAATIATTGPRSKPKKSSARHGMAEGSVWFRAAIGRRKNAEARWLLPMICRRGGIDKQDIGAIRDHGHHDRVRDFRSGSRNPSPPRSSARTRKTTSASRRSRMRRKRAAVPEKQSHTPRRAAHDEAAEFVRNALSGHSHDERAPKPRDEFHGDKSHAGKPHAGKPRADKSRNENMPGSSKPEHFKTRKRHQDKPTFTGNSRRERGAAGKPAFGKKQQKKFRG